jgi:hypothetical protein
MKREAVTNFILILIFVWEVAVEVASAVKE